LAELRICFDSTGLPDLFSLEDPGSIEWEFRSSDTEAFLRGRHALLWQPGLIAAHLAIPLIYPPF
jgi:hypothetical protein